MLEAAAELLDGENDAGQRRVERRRDTRRTPGQQEMREFAGILKPNQRPNRYIRLAPTCTVGPSRPTDAPPSSDNDVSSSLPAETAGERLVFRNGSSGLSNAAMTCGMPLPAWASARRK